MKTTNQLYSRCKNHRQMLVNHKQLCVDKIPCFSTAKKVNWVNISIIIYLSNTIHPIKKAKGKKKPSLSGIRENSFFAIKLE